MTSLFDRIDRSDENEPAIRATGVPLAEVHRRLKNASPRRVMENLGLEASDVVAALAVAGLGFGDFDGPPLVQSKPRAPGLVAAASADAIAALVPEVPIPARLTLAAGLLQVLDDWDASHNAAQEADDLGESSFSAYWHGIAHRREPDAGNASYWFRRVGTHPMFEKLAAEAARIQGSVNTPLAERLIRGGSWDPFEFIKACASRPNGDEERVLRALQRAEMRLLLDATADTLG